MHQRTWSALIMAGVLGMPVCGQTAAETPQAVVAGAVQAAERLLAALEAPQRAKLLFKFDDLAQRRHWSNLPTGIFERRGLRMGDLTDAQRDAVFGLLKATLSEQGFRQVVENMEGDEALKGQQRVGRLVFGKAEYYVSILGQPSATAPWMWQFGGHHLALNATFGGDRITLSPSLTGGQPMSYTLAGKQVRQLGREVDKAHALAAALTPDESKLAVLGDRLSDLRFGPGRDGAAPKPEGIKASTLNAQAKKLLLELIGERIGLLRAAHALPTMQAIEKELDQTWFSWHGPTAKGEAATFRIQGPRVLIEFSPQRMGGDATQHIHAMYRDPQNDYGAAFAK
jgi:hypothetical protein